MSLSPVLRNHLLHQARSLSPLLCRAQHEQRRTLISSRSARLNTVVNFIPQQEAWIVERFGKFNRVAEAGFRFVIPFLEQISYVRSLKETAMDVPSQSGITSDNVTLSIDGVLYIKVVDPYKASYGIENYVFAVSQLAQTTMRSELGKLTLDKIFQERETLNAAIVDAINSAAEAWGVLCLRYEIKDIDVPDSVKQAMQMQVEAERKKRAHVLESEGQRISQINIAEGEKQAKILRSEAAKAEKINEASGTAEALRLQAVARSEAIKKIADAISQERGSNAAAFAIAEQYMTAFKELAQESTTLMLPTEVNNPSSMIAQAMGVYQTISNKEPGSPHDAPPGAAAGKPHPQTTPPLASSSTSSQKTFTNEPTPKSTECDIVELLKNSATRVRVQQ